MLRYRKFSGASSGLPFRLLVKSVQETAYQDTCKGDRNSRCLVRCRNRSADRGSLDCLRNIGSESAYIGALSNNCVNLSVFCVGIQYVLRSYSARCDHFHSGVLSHLDCLSGLERKEGIFVRANSVFCGRLKTFN